MNRSLKHKGTKLKAPKAKRSANLTFSSEEILQQAIAVLLTRMIPDVTGVQILQGTRELGKDLIFYIRGAFGEPVLCACVVKNIKITGDVATAGGARTILFQAQQAFDSVHTDGLGKDTRVERVYVVTPFDLAPSTIASISGSLQERAGQVLFIGGPMLFDLFKRYWPDYLADEPEIIEQHLKNTKSTFVVDSPVPGLAFQYNLGDTAAYPKKIYVNQLFYRDLCQVEAGPVLMAPLPKQSVLSKELTYDEFHKIELKLQNLHETVGFLNEWEFCTTENKSKLQILVAHFLSLLRSAWRNGQTSKRGYPPKDVVKLDKLSLLTERLAKLTALTKLAFSDIEAALATAKRTISSQQFHGIQSLSDPSFLSACALDDCARCAPDGIFKTKKAATINLPRNILEEWNDSILIIGAAGYGKTSFCRWHALQDTESFSAEKSGVLPVYVPLHKLTRKPLRSFEETFLGTLGKSALLRRGSSKEISEVRLYLDGLDEIPSPVRRREIVELAMKGARGKTRRRYQVVLTSRDHILARWLEWLPRVALGGFEDTDISEFIDKWLGHKSESNAQFRKQLAQIPTLNGLMRIPLLATLIIMVFRQTGKLPESKPRLYEIFIDLLSGGWDLAKGILRGSKFRREEKVMTLMTLASSLHERRRREFDDHDIKTSIQSTILKSKLRDWEDFRDEFIMDGLVSRSGSVFQFSHLSFQEFLTAKDFMGSPQPLRANRALESYLYGDDWWKEVLQFYVGLSTSPRELANWLAHQIRQAHSAPYARVSSLLMNDLLTAVLEAFPAFPVDELASKIPATDDFQSTLSFLRKFHQKYTV